MPDVFDEINAGLLQNGAAVLAQTQQTFENQVVNIDQPVIDPPAITDSSLTDKPVVDVSAQADPTLKADPIPTKSLDELLAERTGGKFKSYDELEAAANAPKEEFANEQIKRINELAKTGVKMDTEYFRFVNKDFDNEIDPEVIFAESRKLEDPGITDKEIALEFKERYRMGEWADEGQEETEVEAALAPKMLREVEQMKAKLIKRQQDISATPQSDPAKEQAIKETNAKMQQGWEKNADDAASKLPKLSYKIPDNTDKNITHDFDFNLTEAESKPVVELVKKMGMDNRVFFDQFKGEDGNYSMPKLYDAMVKLQHSDKIAKSAYQAGLAKGSLKEISGIKNIQFNTDGSPVVQKAPSNAEAMRASVEKSELGI